MQLQENIIFDSRYTLIRQLGRGGFSEVWLAHDSYMDLDVALKIYAPGQGMDQSSIDEFRHEIKDVFNLNHSNLLKPQYLGIYDKMPYLVLSYCHAGSVTQHIGRMSEQQIWKLIHDVAAGLAYLHERDIVHQDIKPDNILIDESGNYVITDFGISTRARTTLRKSVVGGHASGGTTAYMGPERFSRQPAPTKASDVWSFGAMVYEVVEGNVPFGEIGGGLQKGGADIPYITANVSDALKFTIYKMLSKDTWDRPTAEKLVAWSQAPQSIEIDYDLLTSEETPEVPPLAPELISEPKPTIIDTSRQTQRFSELLPQPKPAFEMSLDALNAPAEGISKRMVKVTSEVEWSANVSTSADWIHIEKTSDILLGITCDKNKTGANRSGYIYVSNGVEQKSIQVTQPSLSSKAWVWILLIIGIIIITIACISINTIRTEAKVKENHETACTNFEYYCKRARVTNIDDTDVDDIKEAAGYLRDIKEAEGNKHYTGRHVYDEKRAKLKSKATTMCSSLQKIKDDAWNTYDISYKNANVRKDHIERITKNL